MNSKKIKIAITGKPGVGKSKLLQYFSNKGYSTFDCDKYVHFLYQKGNIGYNFIKQRLGTEYLLSTKVDIEKLRRKIMIDKNIMTEIENYIYPEIRKNILENNYDVVEIAKIMNNKVDFTDLFDLIFNITRNENQRIELLKSRVVNKTQYKFLMGIDGIDINYQYVNIYVYNIDEAIQIIENKLSKFKKI